MAKHRRAWNQGIYEKYLYEGRGQGEGIEYVPWICIQDFASKGIVSRVKGMKTGRVHHLMSKNELAYFYMLDWSDKVLDIREQYPLLNLECAINAAKQAGIKYPIDAVSGYPYVLTCDFMITTADGLKARTVKLSSELSNRRTIAKLEIERRYWDEQGVDWRLVTENEISYQRATNIEWLYCAQNFMPENILQFSLAKSLMAEMFEYSNCSIVEIAMRIEKEFCLTNGMGLLLFKQLVLNREIVLDLDKPLNLSEREFKVSA